MSFKQLVDAAMKHGDAVLAEVSPPGFKGTTKAMKKRHEDEIDNPYALSWWMKKKGYKSHKKATGGPKDEAYGDVHTKERPVGEAAPKGWEGTVKAMKDEPDIDNPYALAHWMKKKGYKSHKKETSGGMSAGNVAANAGNLGKQEAPSESIRVEHPLHGTGTVEEITESDIEITWDNLEKRIYAPNRIAFPDAKYLTRLQEQYSSDPEDVEVGKKKNKKKSDSEEEQEEMKEDLNESLVAVGMSSIDGTHRGSPVDEDLNIIRFEDLLDEDDEWKQPFVEDDDEDQRQDLRKTDKPRSDYVNVPRPADSILTNQEDQPEYNADPLATMAGYDAAGSGDEPNGDYGTDLNPVDAPETPTVRDLEGSSSRHNTRDTGEDDDTSEVEAGEYDETKPEDKGEKKMKNESLWLSAEDLGLDLTEREHGASMTGYAEDEGMYEHDMGAGEIAFTREFLDKLLAAVSEQSPDEEKLDALCDGLEAAQKEKGDVGLDTSDWDKVKSAAADAYSGAGKDDELGDYEGDVEADPEMAPGGADLPAEDDAYFEKGGDDYWNEEDKAEGDGEEAGPEGGPEHEGKTKMMDRKGEDYNDTEYRVKGRPQPKSMRRRKPKKSQQKEARADYIDEPEEKEEFRSTFSKAKEKGASTKKAFAKASKAGKKANEADGSGTSGTPIGTGNVSGSGGGGQKDLSAPKKYKGKPLGTGTKGPGGSSADEFGQEPSERGGSNNIPAVDSGSSLGAAENPFSKGKENPRNTKPLAAESKRERARSKKKLDEAILLGMSSIDGVIRDDASGAPDDADWDDELKAIKRRAGMENWWK